MRVLVIDDDIDSLDAVADFLENPMGFDVTKIDSCDKGLELYKKEPFPLIISDIKMSGMTGLEFLKAIKSTETGVESDVILMTGFGEFESCLNALRDGASDYILKPIYIHQLDLSIKRVLERRELKAKVDDLQDRYRDEVKRSASISSQLKQFKQIYSDIIDNEDIGIFSEKMNDIVETALKLHENPDLPALIEGETGTGKEVIAKLIHNGKEGCSKPFITINCAAISPSLFESELFGYEKGAFTGAKSEGSIGKLQLANGGTIFLDEIGEMPIDMQPKLLRAIQQKEIYPVGGKKLVKLDLRFICATNRSLKEMSDKHLFRKDLFFRLNLGYIYIPPLRERKGEIAPLVKMMIDKLKHKRNINLESISRDALSILEGYEWPGNLRELKNCVERVAFLNDSTILKAEDLQFLESTQFEDDSKKFSLDLSGESMPLKEVNYLLATKVHKIFKGNVNRSAKFLDVAWSTFVKIARLK